VVERHPVAAEKFSLPILTHSPAKVSAMNAHVHVAGLGKARLKRAIAMSNAIAFGIGLWTILFATSFYWLSLAMCFAIPLAAIALDTVARGTLDFEARRRRSPLSLATLLMVPAIALGSRAVNDLNFTSYTALLALTVLAIVAIVALFLRFDPSLKSDFNQLTTVTVFALAWSYGVIAFADVILDPSSGRDIPTVIRDKRVHVSGNTKGSSIWRKVAVDPAVVPGGSPWIEVRPDLFAGFPRGDIVCVHQGPGLLGAAWYGVRHCKS
jgi:hypothetical protein